MSEKFFCRGEQVHFSNAACESLFNAWSELARQYGRSELAEILEKILQAGSGCVSTGIDREYLNDDLTEEDRRREWAEVMAQLISRIDR